jgi:hypothetical protein
MSAHTPAVIAAAKAMARLHAEACNVDYDDLWKLESDWFLTDAEKVLDAIAHDDLLEALASLVAAADDLGPCEHEQCGEAGLSLAILNARTVLAEAKGGRA